jgi:hypothetical protein
MQKMGEELRNPFMFSEVLDARTWHKSSEPIRFKNEVQPKEEKKNMDNSMVKNGLMVTVVGRGNGHNYPIGMVGKIKEFDNDDEFKLEYVSGPEKQGGNWIKSPQVELFSKTRNRADQAKHLEENVLPGAEAEATIAQLRVDEVKADIFRLKTFDSDEAETAHVLAEVMKADSDEASITKALKATNILRVLGAK